MSATGRVLSRCTLENIRMIIILKIRLLYRQTINASRPITMKDARGRNEKPIAFTGI